MIRRINTLDDIPDDHIFLFGDQAAIKNPVDMVAVYISCKSMMSTWKGLLKDVFENLIFIRCFLIFPGEDGVAGTQWRGIKVSQQDCGNIAGQMCKPLHDQFRAGDLNRDVKVKVGIDADEPATVFFEHADGALSGPETFPEAARNQRCRAQKKVLLVKA